MKNKNQLIKETGIRAVIASIPYVGGALIEIGFEHRNRVKTERLLDFLERLKLYLEGIDKAEIDESFISSERFSDIFEEIVNTVAKTDDTRKVERLRQLLTGSIKPNAQINQFENFIDFTRKLNDTQILILERFYLVKPQLESINKSIKIMEAEYQAAKQEVDKLRSKAQNGTILINESIGQAEYKLHEIESPLISARKSKEDMLRFNKYDFNSCTEEEAIFYVEDLLAKRLLIDVSPIQHGDSSSSYNEIMISEIGSKFIKYLKGD